MEEQHETKAKNNLFPLTPFFIDTSARYHRMNTRMVVQFSAVSKTMVAQLVAALTGLEGALCCLPANLLVSGDFSLQAAQAASGSLPVVAGKPGERGESLWPMPASCTQQTAGETDYYGLLAFLRNSGKQPLSSEIQCRLLTNLDAYLDAQRSVLDESWPEVRIPASRR